MMYFQILRMILEIDGLAKKTQARINRQLVLGLGEDQWNRDRPRITSNHPMDLSI